MSAKLPLRSGPGKLNADYSSAFCYERQSRATSRRSEVKGDRALGQRDDRGQ